MKTPLDNDLDRLYEAFHEDHDRLRQTLLASLPDRCKTHKEAGRIVYVRQFIRGTIMRSKIAKLAAAVIVIAVLLGVHYFGGSLDGGSAVYAAAIKALQNIHTVHISGWTRRLYPKHSTVLDEPLDTSQQYAVEIWEWVTENDEYRIYDRQGPITVWDDGDRNYEYHEYKAQLYISKSVAHLVAKDLEHFQSVRSRLNRLRDRDIKIIEIGDRTIGDRKAKGLRVERDNKREDIWLDSQTNLMLEDNAYIFEQGQWRQYRHGILTYDQHIPVNIRTYVPPDTKNIEYSWDIAPRFEKWHLHLRKIAAYYQQHALPKTMELLPRESAEKIDAYSPGRLPDITDASRQWVLPIQSSLADLVRTRIKPFGSLRVPKDLQKMKLNHDLITSNKFTQRQRAEFVLDELGLEIIEITEQRTVWVAHYDGRPLKPWQSVRAPVSQGDTRAIGPGMASGRGAFSMKHLLESFAYYQDYDLTAKNIIIVNETGLPLESTAGSTSEESAVSSESPYWGGDESIEIAKKWFAEQFGVTFTEETRPMTIYVVRKRE